VCSRLERQVLNAGLIVPTTSYVADEFRRLAPRGRIEDPLPIPVDMTWFTAPDTPVQGCDIAFVGKYNDARKNAGLLIKVVRICRDRGLPVVLHLYGDNPGEAVRREIQRLQVEPYVKGLAKISTSGLRSLYRSTAVFVIPSFQEGFCVAGVEALASGCPVVTTACGGPQDYVLDGRNGYVVPIDAEAMAERVIHILRSPELRRRMPVEARAIAVERFSPDLIERRFMLLLERVFG
jgi:glycosyltransferase involved in cell wall biosynthesis